MLAKRFTDSGDEVRVIDLAKTRQPHLNGYQKIIIGGSIHVGRIQREIKTFCERHNELLMNRKLGLFICCMETSDKKRKLEFEDAYPAELIKHASAKGIMGGEFLLEKMNFIERLVVRKVAHTRESVHDIDTEALEKFIKDING